MRDASPTQTPPSSPISRPSRFALSSGARAKQPIASIALPFRPRPPPRRPTTAPPFRFLPLNSSREADPNFEFRQTHRALRPRAAVAFASCLRNDEEGDALSFRRAVRRRSSPCLCFVVGIILTAPYSGAKRESETKRKRGEERRRTEHALGTQQQIVVQGERGARLLIVDTLTRLKSPSRSPSDFSRSMGTRRNTKN